MTVDEVIELANLSLQSRAVSNGLRPLSPMSDEAMDTMFDVPTCETLQPNNDDNGSGGSGGASSTAMAKNADKVITNDVETILKHLNPKSAENTKKRGIEMLLRGLRSQDLRDTVARKFVAENDGAQLLLSTVCSVPPQLTVSSAYILIGALKGLTYLALPESCVARQVRLKAGSSDVFAALKGALESVQTSSAMPLALQRTLHSTVAQTLAALCEKNPVNCRTVLESGFLGALFGVLSSAVSDCRATASFGEYEVVIVSVLRFFELFCSFGGSVRALRALPLADVLVPLVGEGRDGVPQSIRVEAEKTVAALSKVSDDVRDEIKRMALKQKNSEAILKLVEGGPNSKVSPFSPYSSSSI